MQTNWLDETRGNDSKVDVVSSQSACRLGEVKFNPVPMELVIQGHSLLADAVIFGQGKVRPALLVEPKPNHMADSEQANLLPHGREVIPRKNINVAKAERPFVRAATCTFVRRLTERAYADDALRH